MKLQEFSLAEKLAIVKMIHAVIIADEKIHQGEMTALSQLMKHMDFDSNFIMQASSIPLEQGKQIICSMDDGKKEALKTILEDMAKADGFVHEKELKFILNICSSIGIRSALE